MPRSLRRTRIAWCALVAVCAVAVAIALFGPFRSSDSPVTAVAQSSSAFSPAQVALPATPPATPPPTSAPPLVLPLTSHAPPVVLTAAEASSLLQQFLDAARNTSVTGDMLPLAEVVSADCASCWSLAPPPPENSAADQASRDQRRAANAAPRRLVTVHAVAERSTDSVSVRGKVSPPPNQSAGTFEAVLRREGALWVLTEWRELP